MSQTESHFGKLVKIESPFDVETVCKSLMEDRGDCLDSYHKDHKEFVEEQYEDILINHNVYNIIDTELDEEDTYRSWHNPDGSIGYAVSFYNGGCGFHEALTDAIKGLKQKEQNERIF